MDFILNQDCALLLKGDFSEIEQQYSLHSFHIELYDGKLPAWICTRNGLCLLV